MATSKSHNPVCAICQDDFRDPVLIQCHHSFCRPCIGEWICQNAKQRQFFCPVCKETNTLPKSGVAGLKRNFYIQQIRDANRYTSPMPLYPICERHPFEDLRFYCMNCNVAACRDCKITGHENHKFECINILAAEIRQDLDQIAAAAKEHLKCLRGIEYKLTLIREDILKQRNLLITKCYQQAENLKSSIDKLAKSTEYEILKKFQPILQNNKGNSQRVQSECKETECFMDSVANLTDSKTNDFYVVSNSGLLLEHTFSFDKRVADSELVHLNYQNKFRVGKPNLRALQDMLGTVQLINRSEEEHNLDFRPAHENEQTSIHPLPPPAANASRQPLPPAPRSILRPANRRVKTATGSRPFFSR